MENEKPSYYSILTANVRYDSNLKPNEKLLFSEITALANKNGYCSAGNAYFANLYHVSKSTVSRWVSHLEKLGYVQVVQNKVGKEIRSRFIYPVATPLLTKKSIGYVQKNQYPIDQKVKENNTSINTTSINKTTTTNLYIRRIKNQDMIQYLNSVDDELAEWIVNENEKAPQPSQRYFESIVKRLMSINALTVEDATRKESTPIPKIELIKLAD